jgi:hypothetical protein
MLGEEEAEFWRKYESLLDVVIVTICVFGLM